MEAVINTGSKQKERFGRC